MIRRFIERGPIGLLVLVLAVVVSLAMLTARALLQNENPAAQPTRGGVYATLD